MVRRIRIVVNDVSLAAEFNDTATAGAIWELLPIKGRANRWGDEIYFRIPAALELEEAREIVEVGALAYWPQGHAFCVFFGPTPASLGDEVRPASAVTVFGAVVDDIARLRSVSSGAEVSIERESATPDMPAS